MEMGPRADSLAARRPPQRPEHSVVAVSSRTTVPPTRTRASSTVRIVLVTGRSGTGVCADTGAAATSDSRPASDTSMRTTANLTRNPSLARARQLRSESVPVDMISVVLIRLVSCEQLPSGLRARVALPESSPPKLPLAAANSPVHRRPRRLLDRGRQAAGP